LCTKCTDSVQMASIGSGKTERDHLHAAWKLDDFDTDAAPEGERPNISEVDNFEHEDKPTGLSGELQSMMDCCQSRILEYLDSRFSACERRFLEKVQLLAEEVGGKRNSRAATSIPDVASVPDLASMKKVEGAMLKHAKTNDCWDSDMAATWSGIVKRKFDSKPRPPSQKFFDGSAPDENTLLVLEAAEEAPSQAKTTTVSFGEIPVVPLETTKSSTASRIQSEVLMESSTSVWTKRRTGKFFKAEKTSQRKTKRAVFVDEDELRERIRKKLLMPQYDVSQLYKDTGHCQQIARSPYFEYFTQAVILLNAVWMAVDVDYNPEDVLTKAHPVFAIGENLFCLYFACEWLIRFLSFRKKLDSITDSWFCLDSLLVAMMVLETWILTLIYALVMGGENSSGLGNASVLRLVRLLRLTRMARLAKLLQAMPELMTIIKGMFVAARTVFFMLCLVTCTVYVFAIGFRQITEGSEIGDEYFSSVPHSMSSLLLGANLPDVQEFVERVSKHNLLFGFILMIFICLVTLTLFNMLIGVLVEVVTVTAAVEKEHMTITYVKDMMEKAFVSADIGTLSDHTIHLHDFAKLLAHPDAHTALTSVGVDVIGLLDFADFIFSGESLTFSDFVEVVLRLRGTNKATVKDVVDLRLFLTAEIQQIKIALADSRMDACRQTSKSRRDF